MSQRAVEGLLGKLLTDGQFRRHFYRDPVTVCERQQIDVTARELEALLNLDPIEVEQFALRLNATITRADIQGDRVEQQQLAAARSSRAVGSSKK